MIIITTNEDNITSKVFNFFLEKVPTNSFRIIHTKDNVDTVYHRVLGAVCGEDSDCGDTDYDPGITD